MSVFTSGANGANVLDSILSGGSIVNRTVSTSEVVATYTDGSTSILYGNFTVSGDAISGGTLTG